MLTTDRSIVTDGLDAWAADADAQTLVDETVTVTTTARPRLVTILYATETGASEDVAGALLREAEGADLTTTLQDVADFDPEDLGTLDVLLFVTSTTGEGEVPFTAEEFFERVEGEDCPDLSGLRFAVLALGDSTYELFCEAGKRLDRALAAAGAARIHDRVDCDVDYEDTAAQWRGSVLAKLNGKEVRPHAAEAHIAGSSERSPRFEPIAARVIENRILTAPGSTKATRHIALEFEDEPPAYVPGDALGLVAQNDKGVVDALLDVLSFDPARQVPANGRMISIAEALAESYEISALTPRFIEGWSKLASSPDLEALQSDDQARIAFIHAHHVIDVARQHPVKGVSAEDFISLLRPLQPRLYSIASSQRVTAREVHLTVAPVEYELHGETRRGVATGQLALRAPVGSRVQMYIHPNEHFRLPEPTTPIIMVGPGTGIAPFRAFLQERSCETDRGKAWLFFGERNREFDFLYHDELEDYLVNGTLTRLDTAFSRDGSAKYYVQHSIAENAAEVVAWIDAGAHIYICGDAGMANDVHYALVRAIAREKHLDAGVAENILSTMRRAKRYQRDVY